MLGILTKLTKNKFLITTLVAIMLVFSFNQSKPKAFVPLAWAGAVLAGMAAETLVTMGVKAVSKQVLKKKADDYAAQALKEGKFDFMGTNPYRNKDGSITITPSANDRAKMAGLIAGGLTGLAFEDYFSDQACVPVGKRVVPFVAQDKSSTEYSQEWLVIENKVRSLFVGHAYELPNGYTRLEMVSRFDGSIYATYDYENINNQTISFVNNSISVISKGVYSIDHLTPAFKVPDKSIPIFSKVVFLPDYNNGIYGGSYSAFEDAGATFGSCDGLIVPSTVEDVYQVPWDMSSDFKMPNHDLLVNLPIKIENVMPVSDDEGEITWGEIEEYYNTSGNDFNSIMDSNIDTYLEKGIITENVYNIYEINNYYTDIGQDIPKEELMPDLEDGSVLPVPDPDTDNGEVVPVQPIDRSLLQIAKESYQYLADTVKSSVDGLTAVTAGATGVITFLGTTMGWLPNEWIVMFSAAFGLGLFAFFFRR